MDAKIVKIAPMKIARFKAVSVTPEEAAFNKLYEWAKPKGLLDDSQKNPLFGFDVLVPENNTVVRGYEF